jgi:hypothetical protein
MVLQVVVLFVPYHLLDKSEELFIFKLDQRRNILRADSGLHSFSEPLVREEERQSRQTQGSGALDCLDV